MTLEQDILWAPHFDTPTDGYREFRELWLRLAANVHQAGRSVLLVGSGTPDQFEELDGRRFFSDVFYAALVCSSQRIRERVVSRPLWRKTGSPEFIEAMITYNDWLVANASTNAPPITVFDTTSVEITRTASEVATWATPLTDLGGTQA